MVNKHTSSGTERIMSINLKFLGKISSQLHPLSVINIIRWVETSLLYSASMSKKCFIDEGLDKLRNAQFSFSVAT